jgi:hypothetical protein
MEDVAIRLALTIVASALIAGLGTTLMVCLAASVSMIEVNLGAEMGRRRAMA